MLIYETEGFLEVESKEIKQLCRSTISVSLGDTGRDAFATQAILCDYLDNSEQRCRVAFYSKTLKRSLVFAVIGSENQSSWQHGQEILAQLGFQLEDVNLKLSPAMVEVVLRDVPGILSPAEARKQRTKASLQLAEFQKNYDEDPENALGKKAALKLSAEKRLGVRSEELRSILEDLFAPEEPSEADHETLVSQVKDLTSRLAAAEALVEAESTQREMSESITAAAEKRIQELEVVLVDVETMSSDTLKQKRKIVKLQRRIKELDAELKSVAAGADKEREKQEQFVADVKAAHEKIAFFEKSLKEAENSLENIHAQLTEEQSVKTQLDQSLKEAELRIKVLGKELENSKEKAVQCGEAVKVSEETQAQLEETQTQLTGTQIEFTETQQALKDALDLNKALEGELASAVEQSAQIKQDLREAEKTCHDMALEEESMTAQVEQNTQLGKEIESLREEYDQECSIRRRLEKGALENDKQIRALEKSLAKITSSSEPPVKEKEAAVVAGEIESLNIELQELRLKCRKEEQSREELEIELGEAHKLIDSLEKMVRETEKVTVEKLFQKTSAESENQKILTLETKLKSTENQLEQEQLEQKKLAKAVATAEKKLAEQEVAMAQGLAQQEERRVLEASVAKTAEKSQSKSSKPLPHELRPAPKKGAFFHPDWDLVGLPCQSSEQVFKAWETVFNVQISLEGYPSQYCMAFLVVLRVGKQKNLYLLYRLKQNKHTLVCVPAKTPKNEASLKKAIKEGLQFLKMSGFDMDEMSSDHIDNSLKSYFLET